jgi:hypothetical protein
MKWEKHMWKLTMTSLHESRSRHLQTLTHEVHLSVAQKDENFSGPMEWQHPQSQRKKKLKTTPYAGNIMITVFWDTNGVILVDVVTRGETINSDAYFKTLQKLKQRYRRVRPNRKTEDMLIQHDNARPHTSLRNQEAIAKFGWNVLPHPSYSPDVAPSDFHLFGPLKDALRVTRFAVRAWLREEERSWYREGMHALVSCWRKAVDGDYMEKSHI